MFEYRDACMLSLVLPLTRISNFFKWYGIDVCTECIMESQNGLGWKGHLIQTPMCDATLPLLLLKGLFSYSQ